MDLYKAIRILHAEKSRLDHVIANLEELERTGGSLKDFRFERRRGRKSMSQEERREVSERMRNYWARRRGQMARSDAG
jgi:hypothetical protein